MTELQSAISGLSCFSCGTAHRADELQTVCKACGLPLRVDLALSGTTLPRERLAGRVASLWRYEEVLPLPAARAVSLGEGLTPLLRLDATTLVKDEAQNPTGSFKARGMAVAVSMAKALGATALQAPSAGNAAGALAA